MAKQRFAGLDVVRTAAILMVLTIHVCSPSISAQVGTSNWWQSLLWASLARPAVPLFFMCSGALMLNRDIPLKRLAGHNLLRIVLAMFAWAMVYKLAALASGGIQLGELWQAVKETLVLKHESHFYYMHIMILVYAFQPVVRTFLRHASRREIEYLLAVWWVTGILFPLLRYFWPFTLVSPISGWYLMHMGYSAIGFGVLGYYLREYGSSLPQWLSPTAWAAGFLLTAGGTAYLSIQNGALSEIFFEGMSPGPMLMALGIFGLAANRENWPEPVKKTTGRWAQASFCVYLVHILVMRQEVRLGWNLTPPRPAVHPPVRADGLPSQLALLGGAAPHSRGTAVAGVARDSIPAAIHVPPFPRKTTQNGGVPSSERRRLFIQIPIRVTSPQPGKIRRARLVQWERSPLSPRHTAHPAAPSYLPRLLYVTFPLHFPIPSCIRMRSLL